MLLATCTSMDVVSDWRLWSLRADVMAAAAVPDDECAGVSRLLQW